MNHKTVLGGSASPSGIDYMSFIFHHIIYGETGFWPLLFLNGLKKSTVSSKNGFTDQGRGTLPLPAVVMDNNGNYKNLFLCVKTAEEKSNYMNEIMVSFDDLHLLITRYVKWVRRIINNHEAERLDEDLGRFLNRMKSGFPKESTPLSEAWGIAIQAMLQEMGVEGIDKVALEYLISQKEPQQFLTDTLLRPISASDLESTINTGDVVFKNMFSNPDEESSVVIAKGGDNFVMHHPPLRFLLWDKQSREVLYTLEPLSIEFFGDERSVLVTSQEIVCISQLLLVGNIVAYPWYFADDVMKVEAVSLINHWRKRHRDQNFEVGSFFEHVFPLHTVDPERFTSHSRLSPTGSTMIECVRFESARRLVQFQVPFLRIDAGDQELFTQLTACYFYSRQLRSSYRSRSGAIRNDLFQWILDRNSSEKLRQGLRNLADVTKRQTVFSATEAFSYAVAYRLFVSDLLELPTSRDNNYQYDLSALRANITTLIQITECIKKSETIKHLQRLQATSSSNLTEFLESAEVCYMTRFDQMVLLLAEHLNKREIAYRKLESTLHDVARLGQCLESMLLSLQDLSPYPLQNGLIRTITGGKTKILGKKIYSCKTLERRLGVVTNLLIEAYPHVALLQEKEKDALNGTVTV
ncbi:MAG: hypothetical protein UW01_C0017G0011 [Candidatus Nomurabacteria bacterium GW2011_GWA2_43_66]|nr:MAG: hypothetical protein UW01_C0017G0011 [Candidatus Nomurabacteria bacterium GW2011_GWA2_43_66]